LPLYRGAIDTAFKLQDLFVDVVGTSSYTYSMRTVKNEAESENDGPHKTTD